MTWPVQPIEHGTYLSLVRDVGGFLTGKFDPNTLSYSERQQVDSVIQSGYMQFCYPPPMPVGEKEKLRPPHTWTFLSPVAELELEIDERRYDLPDNFAGIVDDFVVQS